MARLGSRTTSKSSNQHSKGSNNVLGNEMQSFLQYMMMQQVEESRARRAEIQESRQQHCDMMLLLTKTATSGSSIGGNRFQLLLFLFIHRHHRNCFRCQMFLVMQRSQHQVSQAIHITIRRILQKTYSTKSMQRQTTTTTTTIKILKMIMKTKTTMKNKMLCNGFFI
jgi:hypothetical protein